VASKSELSSEPRDEIRLGGPAEDRDGPVGQLQSVGVEFPAMSVCYLRLALFPLGQRIAHSSSILSADGELVALADSWHESRWPVSCGPAALLEVRHAMGIEDVAGRGLARLEYLCIGHESHQVKAVVGSRGRVAPELRMIPSQRIQGFRPNILETDLDPNEWSSLPRFELDRYLYDDVIDALERDPQLKFLSLRAPDLMGRHAVTALQVSVQDQEVTLRGHVRFSGLDRRAIELVESVPSVLRVEPMIFCDDILELEIAETLARALGDASSAFTIRSYLGHIDLVGDAPPALRQRAEQLAASVPGVTLIHTPD
jgi:hypothetical protein